MKKIQLLLICFILILSVASVSAEIKNPDTFIKVTYSTLVTLDPAVCYADICSQRLGNIYEGLIWFDGPHTDKYIPRLAIEVPSVENGGISADGKTYTFTIRKGVKFQDGGDLTPEDIEYSFERNMLADPDGGPMWMMLEALTGEDTTRGENGELKPGIVQEILDAVEVDGDKLILHLPKPYPPFLGILAGSWAVALDKEWAVEHGCWDGIAENAAKYNNPQAGHEPLHEITNGTGPYMMKHWESSKEFVFDRFDGYWGPAPKLKSAIVKYVPEWSTRKLMLINGDADYVSVDDPYVEEMAEYDGLKTYKVPQLYVTVAMFCQHLNPAGNPNIGSGKLDGNGIPPDFFSDINVRKAFMYAFDRETYSNDVLRNISTIPTNPNLPGLPYAIEVPVYEFDLEKAKEYMMNAWDGQVWEKGFKMTISYNTGNARRESAALMLAENIMSLNPKFQIELNVVDLKDYMVKYQDYQYPIWLLGWIADYPDPHNMLYPFMHSNGYYAKYMANAKPEIDELIQQGIETQDPAKRAEIYEKLQNLWYSDAIGLCLYQSTEIRHYRDWVQGFIPNPTDTDVSEWFFRLWKEEEK